MPSMLPPLIVIRALKDLADFAQIPALAGVLGVASVLLEDVQALKSNNVLRDALAAQITEMVLAIHEQLSLATSQKIALPDEVLCAIEGLNDTLMRTHGQLNAHKKRGAVSRFIRKTTDTELMKGCREDIQRATEIYFLQANIFMQRATAAMAEPKTSDPAYMPPPPIIPALEDQSIRRIGHRLPSQPHIIMGRDEFLLDAIEWLTPPSTTAPRHVAVLGPPGIGKSTVARAVLHHPTIITTLATPVYIDCSSHSTLAGVLGSLGVTKSQFVASLRPSNDVRHVPTLLVIDALDMILAKDQIATEAFIKTVLDLPHVRAVLVARGASTPAWVPKTILKRIVLPPLDDVACKQVFAALCDREPDSATLAQADGLPLALTLLAHRPEGDQLLPSTSLEPELIEQNRLDSVIGLSVDLLDKDAKDCLAILARAPDGLTRHLLPNSRGVTALLGSGLATRRSCSEATSGQKDVPLSVEGERIHALTPIRTYALRHLNAPAPALAELRKYYFNLAIRATEIGTASTTVVMDMIARESGNLNKVISEALRDGPTATVHASASDAQPREDAAWDWEEEAEVPAPASADSTAANSDNEWRDAIRAFLAVAWWQHWTGNMDRGILDLCLLRLNATPSELLTAEDYSLLSQCQFALARTMTPASAEGRALVTAALASARKIGDIGLEVDALTKRTVADVSQDLERLKLALELLPRLDNADDKTPTRKARLYLELGQLHCSSSDTVQATKYFGLARELSSQLNNSLQLRARVLFSYGHTCMWANKAREAGRAYSQALSEFEAVGSAHAAHCIAYLANLCERRQQWTQARSLYDEAARRYAKFGLQMDWTLAKCGATRTTSKNILSAHWHRHPISPPELVIPDPPPMPEVESGWVFGRGAVFLAKGYQTLAHSILTIDQRIGTEPEAEVEVAVKRPLSLVVPATPAGRISLLSSAATSSSSLSTTPTESPSSIMSDQTSSTALSSPISVTGHANMFVSSARVVDEPVVLDEHTIDVARMQFEDAWEFGLAARMAFRKRSTRILEADCEVLLAEVLLASAVLDPATGADVSFGRHRSVAADNHFIVALLLLRSRGEGLASSVTLRRWLGDSLRDVEGSK